MPGGRWAAGCKENVWSEVGGRPKKALSGEGGLGSLLLPVAGTAAGNLMVGKPKQSFWLLCLVLLAGAGWLWTASTAATMEHGISEAPPMVAGEQAVDAHAAGGHGAEGHEGLRTYAPVLFEVFGFQVTNAMLATWLVTLLLIVISQLATRNVQLVPRGLQNFWEWLVELLYDFLAEIMGRELARKTFWFFATIFIFILAANYFGLLPGVGSIGWGVPDADGKLRHISEPLLRGANADLNMTFGMALVFFACWFVWALQANGPGGFLHHIFGVKGESTGFMKVLMVGIFAFAGLLEVVSILFRPVSLSFRLYGNIFAGENMLETMALISPWFGWLVALPFYLLELLVGLVQAMVFALLTAVFVLTICQHEEEHPPASEGSGHS